MLPHQAPPIIIIMFACYQADFCDKKDQKISQDTWDMCNSVIVQISKKF